MKHLLDYVAIHSGNPRYGSGPKPADIAAILEVTRNKVVHSAVDWGCGNSKVLETLWPNAIRSLYDPALPAYETIPSGLFDVGLCTDVMEHIPEEELDGTLENQSRICAEWIYIIHKHPARQLLSDGSNAHVSQHDEWWWAHRMGRFFARVSVWPCHQSKDRFFLRANH